MLNYAWAPNALRCSIWRHQRLMWTGNTQEFMGNFDKRQRERETARRLSQLALEQELFSCELDSYE
jgi:hypothetical protein